MRSTTPNSGRPSTIHGISSAPAQPAGLSEKGT